MIARTILSLLAITLAGNSVVGQSPAPFAVAPFQVPGANLLADVGSHRSAAAAPVDEGDRSPGVDRVIVAFKTHFDIGYTDLAVNVLARYRTEMIDKALEVCEQTRHLPPHQQFVWTVPGWPMIRIIEDWPGQNPQRQEQIRAACKEGRFAIHGLPFTTHTELLEAEDLVRGTWFSAELSRSMGLPLPRDAKMTDVPSHSWILPTLLKHAGMDFLHLGCNDACRSPQVPMLFWWEGPDGSRLLTMYAAGGYGTGLTPPADWPYRTWLALIHTGDNQGPPAPGHVLDVLAKIERELPRAEIRIGRLSDFADAIRAEQPDLPVVRGDMPDTWIHGPMCDPAGAKLARNIRPAIASTETLHTHLAAWGVETPDSVNAIAAACEQSLLYGEHTWGKSLHSITTFEPGKVNFNYGATWEKERAEGRFDRLEESWREHTAYVEKARDLLAPVQARGIHALAAAVDTSGDRIVVYNPLPWKRTGLVTVQASGSHLEAVRCASDGDTLPVEVDGDTLRFVARDVPPMGYRTYVPWRETPATAQLGIDPAKATLESPFFVATIDRARGCIGSLINKRTGKELAERDGPHGLGQYLYERFDAGQVEAFKKAYLKGGWQWSPYELGKPNMPPADEVPYQALTPQGFDVRFEQSGMAVTAIMDSQVDARMAHRITSTVRLYGDMPFVDVEIVIHGKPDDPWPEACWICLPFNVDQPRFALSRLGSIVDPIVDFVPGSNHHLYAINGGLAVLHPDGAGVGACPMDHPLVSLDNPGLWKYSDTFTPTRPRAYINVFNNQWTTNFRFWNSGTWSSRVRLWAIDNHEPARDLVTPSQEARFPLVAARVDAPAGKLPVSGKGLEVSCEGVLVTMFGMPAGGKELMLRVWEHAGRSGRCEIRLPEGLLVRRAQPINLRGEPAGKPVAVRDGAFAIDLGAFAPASFRLIAHP